MIAFFLVSGNGSTREEVTRVSFSSENNNDNKKKGKEFTIGQEMWFGEKVFFFFE